MISVFAPPSLYPKYHTEPPSVWFSPYLYGFLSCNTVVPKYGFIDVTFHLISMFILKIIIKYGKGSLLILFLGYIIIACKKLARIYTTTFCIYMQILNLTSAIESKKTPWELVNMPPVVVESIRQGRTRQFIQKFRARAPFFTGC